MYVVTEPRSVEDAVGALLLPDADYSMHRLLDAMLALPQFGHPDRPGFTGDNPERAIIGTTAMWTYARARTVIDHAFGGLGHLRLVECVAQYRDQSVTSMDEVFFLRIGLLLRGGWTREIGWDWFIGLGHVEMPLDLSAGWVGSWSVDTLTACVCAGLRIDALRAVLNSGTLPPPETVAMLGGLHRDLIAQA